MTINLIVIAYVKQLRTGGSFRIHLPFFRTSWGVGVWKSEIFNSFLSRVDLGTILEGLPNFGGGGVDTPTPPSVPHCTENFLELKYYWFIRNSADYLIVSSPSVHDL